MKEKKSNYLAIKILGFLVLGLLFGYTAGTIINSGDRASTITEVLKDHCNCKEVNQLIYAKGIQYGKDGLTTEKAEYQLIDCNYDVSVEGIEKLNQHLKEKVKNFEQLDFLELEFIRDKQQKTFIIKNGNLTTKPY